MKNNPKEEEILKNSLTKIQKFPHFKITKDIKDNTQNFEQIENFTITEKEGKYIKAYEKSSKYYLNIQNFKGAKCDICQIVIYHQNELCFFESIKTCFYYIIYVLQTNGGILHTHNNLDILINNLKEYKFKHMNKGTKRTICKFCLLKIVNFSNISKLLENIFSNEKDYSNKVQKNYYDKSIFFKKDIIHIFHQSDFENLKYYFFQIIININWLNQSISMNRDKNYIKEKGDIKEEIRVKYEKCKYFMNQLVCKFFDIDEKIQYLSFYLNFRENFETLGEIQRELRRYSLESLQFCQIIKTYSYILDTC